MGKAKPKSHHFAFDRVFGPASSQAGVFEEISQLVQSALDGYNICIFAYGQTGSGKTFTMEGGAEAEERGMIPRAVQQIFATAAELETKGWTYTFAASFLEIYQESIRDLLADPSASEQKLEVKKVKGSADVEVPGLTVQAVTSEEEINAVLERAAAVRATARTEMNERSSRSHSVFQLRITGTNAASGDTCAATLNLIDLAGSERVASSKAEGERLQEAKAINKSLSSLGNVIMALGNGVSCVVCWVVLALKNAKGEMKNRRWGKAETRKRARCEVTCILRGKRVAMVNSLSETDFILDPGRTCAVPGQQAYIPLAEPSRRQQQEVWHWIWGQWHIATLYRMEDTRVVVYGIRALRSHINLRYLCRVFRQPHVHQRFTTGGVGAGEHQLSSLCNQGSNGTGTQHLLLADSTYRLRLFGLSSSVSPRLHFPQVNQCQIGTARRVSKTQ